MNKIDPQDLNWSSLGTWIVSVVGLLIALYMVTKAWFKDKAEEREAMIDGKVTKAVESKLNEIKVEVNQLKNTLTEVLLHVKK